MLLAIQHGALARWRFGLQFGARAGARVRCAIEARRELKAEYHGSSGIDPVCLRAINPVHPGIHPGERHFGAEL